MDSDLRGVGVHPNQPYDAVNDELLKKHSADVRNMFAECTALDEALLGFAWESPESVMA